MSVNRTTPRPNIEDDLPECNTCSGACVYKVVESIFIAGIIANVLVVALVLKDKRLRSPTYVAIACLALSDAIFVTTNIIGAVEIVVRSLTCTFPLTYGGPVVATVKGICWFSANAHVSVLAFVRYVLVLYPLKSHVYLTTKKIIMSSAFVWTLGILIWITAYVLQQTTDVDLANSVIFLNIVWIIVYITPLLITTILHCRKIRHIQQMSRTNLSGSGRLHDSSVRMIKIILIVIVLALLLPLPRFIFQSMERSNYEFPSGTVSTTFRNVSFLLFLLNHSINPFIYAFMSVPFRRSLQSLCCRISKQTSVNQTFLQTVMVATSHKTDDSHQFSESNGPCHDQKPK